MTIILLQIAHNLHFALFLTVFVTKRKANITFPASLVYTLSFCYFFLVQSWKFMRFICKNRRNFAAESFHEDM